MRLVHTWVVVLMLALASVVLPARAQDLVIALRSEPTSLDPQYHALTSNIQIAKTVFDPLVRTDGDGTPIPALAHSWSVKGNVWEFFLREDVRFSDGTSFTAADVLFTYRRVFRIANSPSSFSLYLGDIARIDAPDAWTVRITTRGPAPTLLTNLSMVPVLAQRAVAALESGPTTIIPQHNGNGLTGTGPYRLVSWVRGQEIVLERNPHYWGDRSAWDRVVYRPIP
ncbi:MAG TPA: ABC transporter substrate-binding protein, partial [Burkholderiaceae bacterium]|nr:ABC transporter substrate-binding protein [Burkholderiaceae bacterium]